MPRLLYLLPYSDDNHIHGGKVRSNWISKKLAEIDNSLQVVFVNDRSYVDEEKPYWNNLVPKELAGDLDFLTRNYSLEVLVDSETELVVFEQPWLWREIVRIKSKYPDIKTVYSSQNVEWELKLKIFNRYLGDQEIEPIIKLIRDLEIEIARNVNAILAVSTEDAQWYEKYSENKVTLAKNGTSFTANERTLAKATQANYGLVVGSAHPPNIEGAITYLSDPDVWLPKGSSLKVVGSLAAALKPLWSGLVNRWGDTCVELIDSLPEAALNQVVANAKVILLPVSYGGGTNLKTAEALASMCFVVGSKSAFRGFEEFSCMEGVFKAENSLEFKKRTIGCLNQIDTRSNRRSIPELHWNYSLDLMKTRLSGLLNE
jgi:hypothetical protein